MYTVQKLVQMAAEEAKGVRGRVLRRRLRSRRFREEYEDLVCLRLTTDPRALGMVPAFSTEGFDKDTEFGIDPDRLREILDIILEYAPQLLDLILSIIDLFG